MPVIFPPFPVVHPDPYRDPKRLQGRHRAESVTFLSGPNDVMVQPRVWGEICSHVLKTVLVGFGPPEETVKEIVLVA